MLVSTDSLEIYNVNCRKGFELLKTSSAEWKHGNFFIYLFKITPFSEIFTVESFEPNNRPKQVQIKTKIMQLLTLILSI